MAKTYITVELEGGEGVQGQTIAFVASLKGSGVVVTEATISTGDWQCEEVTQYPTPEPEASAQPV